MNNAVFLTFLWCAFSLNLCEVQAKALRVNSVAIGDLRTEKLHFPQADTRYWDYLYPIVKISEENTPLYASEPLYRRGKKAIGPGEYSFLYQEKRGPSWEESKRARAFFAVFEPKKQAARGPLANQPLKALLVSLVIGFGLYGGGCAVQRLFFSKRSSRGP